MEGNNSEIPNFVQKDDEVFRHRITIRFYEELNDFLPSERRKKDFDYRFNGKPAVKDVIEALGVPHTEVDLVLVDGVSVDFNYHLKNGDRVSVYPVFESLDISPAIRLRPRPLREVRFILDVHLGKLARNLRMLGFDVAYSNKYKDAEIITKSLSEKRTILTRDRALLKCSTVTHGYCLRSTDSEDQIREVLNRFDLKGSVKPFCRCIECNGLIEAIEADKVGDKVPAESRRAFSEYFRCADCKRIYWKGSHYEAMKKMVERFLILN